MKARLNCDALSFRSHMIAAFLARPPKRVKLSLAASPGADAISLACQLSVASRDRNSSKIPRSQLSLFGKAELSYLGHITDESMYAYADVLCLSVLGLHIHVFWSRAPLQGRPMPLSCLEPKRPALTLFHCSIFASAFPGY